MPKSSIVRRLCLVVKLFSIYVRAKYITKKHYDVKMFMNGKHAVGGKYGRFCAPIWKLVLNDYYDCKKLHVKRDVPWPVSPRISVVGPENIIFHPDDLNNFQTFGNYYQGIGRITIGHGTYIAPNVGIITANHDFFNMDKHSPPKPVTLGECCWVGMNSTILPGVILGNHTVVGAGSVVTKSFPEGYCIIAGNPAKVIRVLEHENE